MADEGNQNGGGGGGAPTATWWDGLPDDVKGNEAYLPFKDKQPADVLNEYGQVSAKLKGAVVVPGENATDEEKQAFAAKLREWNGVPETADKYQVQLPEGVTANDPLLAAFVKAGHAEGMNSKQVQAGINAFVEYATAAKAAEMESAKTELQEAWKADFDANMTLAKSTIRKIAAESGVKEDTVFSALEQGLGNNVALVKMFHNLSRFYKEDGGTPGGGGTPITPKTLAESLYGGLAKQ